MEGTTMRRKRAGKPLLAGLLALTGLAWAAGASAGQYDRIVVFGDSLADPGNAFELLRTTEAPPFGLIPSAPYARGGHRFSNGATWVEQLAEALRVHPSARPALQQPGRSFNYAVGGARARATGPYHLAMQVDRFLGDVAGAAPADALYVVHIGGNDLRDALLALGDDPSGAVSVDIVGQALEAIGTTLVELTSVGARTLLVPNGPNLALVPAVRMQGPGAQAAARFLAVMFNAELAAMLTDLEAGLRAAGQTVTIVRLDVFTMVTELVAAPAAAGLTEVEEPCITPFTAVNPFCSQPDRYLFWDGIHPTRAGHAILARGAHAVLAPVEKSGRGRNPRASHGAKPW
jgi:phospholipase/lecithinase/hemolysin